MKLVLKALLLAVLLGLTAVTCASGQTVSASATQSGRSSGTPSTLQIKQNFLSINEASIQRQMRAALRCIANARQNLRDLRGNINRVAQTDLINCGRKVAQLQRLLERMGRKAGRLAVEAEALALQAAILQQTSSTETSSEE